jgi:hypothetical protein
LVYCKNRQSQTKEALEQRVNITVIRLCGRVGACVYVVHIVVTMLPRTEVRLLLSSLSFIKLLRLKSLRQICFELYDIPFLNSVFRLFSDLHTSMAVFEGSITKTTVQVALCVCFQVSSVCVSVVSGTPHAWHKLHIRVFLTSKKCICKSATFLAYTVIGFYGNIR